MSDAIHLKYLAIGPNDLTWGVAVNSVGRQQVSPGEHYPPSNHPSRYLFSTENGRILDEYQLLYITRGEGTFRSVSLAHPVHVQQGSMFLLFPGEWHSYKPDPETGWAEYWIGFQGSQMDTWVRNGFFSPTTPVWHAGLHNELVQLYEEAIEAAMQQQSGFQPRLGGLLAHLLSLGRFYARNEALSDVADLVNQAKILISEQFRTITPESVAENLHLGYSNFRRIFKMYTGISPARYIHDVKIGKVKETLTNTSHSIKRVAFDMGFDNEDYFFTAFKRATGMTPLEYRRFTQGKGRKA